MRLTTMAAFNRNTTSDSTNKFFTLPDFATGPNNNRQLQACDNPTNDSDRIVLFYSGYHAARVLSKTDFYNDDLASGLDPDWDMAASKCGNFPEMLIHREEQVSIPYGTVERAYK